MLEFAATVVITQHLQQAWKGYAFFQIRFYHFTE
jgi:hypothetical protein